MIEVFCSTIFGKSRIGEYPLEVRMSKKHQANGQKKKMTKKEMKALNHAKLMANKGSSNVVDLNAFRETQEKKKAA